MALKKSDTCCLSDIEESDSDVVTSLKRLERSLYDSAAVWLQWLLKSSAFQVADLYNSGGLLATTN